MATASKLLSQRDLEFLLYEWLDVEQLTTRERFSEHSRATFDAAIDLARTIAEKHFAPHSALSDAHEPEFVDGKVTMIAEVGAALRVFADSGLLAAGLDHEHGGMQLPSVLCQATSAWLQAANVSTCSYPFLTLGNLHLLLAHGSPELIATYVPPMVEGRFFGTMCLSEPQAGSSLADITTRAERQPDGTYRLFGNKMWISAGDHELGENIVHLVLAKVVGSPAGVKGISLFVVPKYLVGEDGSIGERNDVVLAGLNHKMGYRGTTNALLNFGEGSVTPGGRAGAVGTIVGEENRGLAYMFHMMNGARIGVGAGAGALGYTGYLHSLEYARLRTQGRPVSAKDPAAPMVPLVAHPDVRRMLLAQKSYVEGALALNLYCATLLDEQATGETPEDRAAATTLLDVLTPVAKSWPSQWCLEANSLALQVHGGYGYTREYPVEQLYRDNRLNPIHEGTHGIQGLDLLGRKVVMNDGAGLTLLARTISATVERAGEHPFGSQLAATLQRVIEVTEVLWGTDDIDLTLANASVYLEATGHLVLAWIWLEQLLACVGKDGAFYDGKRAAAAYFFRWELPRTTAQLDLLASLDRTTLDMQDAWF